ncbi:MAG: hypothetical protein M0P12_00190 [Paludibacteraceae bacterium]|nr:hypothetical protein [Paludibacteraceae bacterium]MCK9615570.1 hypothetical protein [Candidatus Omnitrophota bacterium]
MNDGFWINYANGKTVRIHEHETDIRNPAIFKKLGFNIREMEAFKPFKLGVDREKFMLWLMHKYPLMRVRGHGISTTFEFDSRSRQSPLDAVFEFAENNLGPFSMLTINNFATKESVDISFGSFKDLMDSDGAEGVLRYGSTIRMNTNVLKELRKISRVLKNTDMLKK